MIIFKTLPKRGSIIVGICVFILDQLSKFWILQHISSGEIIHINSYLNFMLVFNPGVTFGWLHAYSNMHYILLVVGICVLSCVVGVWWWKAENAVQRYATAMIFFGALGNLADRLRFRAVVDFLDFHIQGWHWYTFNLADSAIVFGVGLLLLDSFYRPKSTFLN